MKANACAFQGGAGVLSRVNSTGRWRSRGRGKQEGQDLELGPPRALGEGTRTSQGCRQKTTTAGSRESQVLRGDN